MNKLTAKQEQYLLMLRGAQGLDRTLVGLATYFEVSKPSAFHIVENLIKENMVKRKEDKDIVLTPTGKQYIEEKYQQWLFFSKWMEGNLGMVSLQAEKEARRLVTALEEETLTAMVDRMHKDTVARDAVQTQDFQEMKLLIM